MTSNGALPTRADLEAAGIRIVVAVPLERTLPGIVFGHFWAIAVRGWPLFETTYGRTDVQRDHFARLLLATEFTHVLMLDLDHLHPPDIVERHALRVLENPDRQVIAGLHFRRGEPFDPLAFVFSEAGSMHPIATWPPNACIEVHALGHGSLLVHRAVFERIGDPPWWAYDYGQAAGGRFPSEDLYFCYLCREAGIRLWVDTGITSPHLIDNVVTEAVYRAWIAQHPEKVRT